MLNLTGWLWTFFFSYYIIFSSLQSQLSSTLHTYVFFYLEVEYFERDEKPHAVTLYRLPCDLIIPFLNLNKCAQLVTDIIANTIDNFCLFNCRTIISCSWRSYKCNCSIQSSKLSSIQLGKQKLIRSTRADYAVIDFSLCTYVNMCEHSNSKEFFS